MSVKKYKFVSPGIFVSEIDNSQIPKTSTAIGPVVIGRAERGPSMRPVTVQSFSEFVEIFGNPIPGGIGGDVWRDGNYSAPSYGTYAAQAWLKNNSPLTYVRLLGAQHTDATTAGEAGWETIDYNGDANGVGLYDSDGGAYGLFIVDSGSNKTYQSTPDLDPRTGSLAAIWYMNEGSIVLTGSSRWGSTITVSGTAVFVQNVGSDNEFKAVIRDRDSNVVKTTTFNFNRNSEKYIRKVFNTNPFLTNSDISTGANTASYWLGQTFERFLDTYVTGSDTYGIILGLKGDSATKESCDYKFEKQAAESGWVFCQDLQIVAQGGTLPGVANSYQPENMTKLFKFVALQEGQWTSKNLKISITNIKASSNDFDPYGTFSVLVRKTNDSDNAVRIIERFSNCNLNPNSENYIAKKIGDKYQVWDDYERRYREYGNFENNSKFIRVSMNEDVDAGATNPKYLPFGFYGPVRFQPFTLLSGATNAVTYGQSYNGAGYLTTTTQVKALGTIVRNTPTKWGITSFVDTGYDIGGTYMWGGAISASFFFPSLQLRSSSFGGNLANPKGAYWGIDTSINDTSTRFDPGYGDYVFPMPVGFDSFEATGLETLYSFIFTLDDISGSGGNNVHAVYHSGSRATGRSFSAVASTNYYDVLDRGFDKFTMPMVGGFDGVDIHEKDPFNNTDMDGGTDTTNYAFNSVKVAIDSVADPEVVECNIITMPGLTHDGLTSHLLTVCEDRADALGIIDLEGEFVPNTENANGDSDADNRGDVDTTVENLRDRGLNTSYGCAYYPWVRIKDTINGASLWCPPSVVALGTFGSSESKSEVWFAPAGFTRGGLTEGSAGIPVIGVREKLTSKQRDKLYESNINPIASFPSEGIVIWGQKTLQVTPSALDRINVRRMLIYVKKEISRMAATILFDQNVKSTWNRFLSKVIPFLRSVQINLGLTDFKVVLDETTTTPDLIDRNILYCQIFLKPARAIEYIAIDFTITNSGASFAD